jgi:sialic acid synthase SpsE
MSAKPFIICECGVNWRDLVDADDMIREAAKAGADAVKFQCYKPDFTNITITSITIDGKQPQLPGYHPRADELNAIALDESTIRYLYWRCQQHGIEFMATPFYPEAVDMLDPYVKRWKVRYADRKNTDLLSKIYATKKEVLISTDNGFVPSENWVKQPHLSKFLYCVSEYPPTNKQHDINGYQFKGVSSHYPFAKPNDSWTLLEYLEVHVRLDKYEPHYCPIDTAVSITMSELAELCRRLKK